MQGDGLGSETRGNRRLTEGNARNGCAPSQLFHGGRESLDAISRMACYIMCGSAGGGRVAGDWREAKRIGPSTTGNAKSSLSAMNHRPRLDTPGSVPAPRQPRRGERRVHREVG